MSHSDHAHAHAHSGHGHAHDHAHGHGHEHGHGAHGEVLAHPVSTKVLVGILMILFFFTFVTVAVSYVDLGNANLFVAMLVASIKASIVALFFMHLFWDKPFNGLILVGAFFFLGIFIGLALLDTKEYQHELVPMYEKEGQSIQQLDRPPG
jgi:cytochrome c oxidase subunit IV